MNEKWRSPRGNSVSRLSPSSSSRMYGILDGRLIVCNALPDKSRCRRRYIAANVSASSIRSSWLPARFRCSSERPSPRKDDFETLAMWLPDAVSRRRLNMDANRPVGKFVMTLLSRCSSSSLLRTFNARSSSVVSWLFRNDSSVREDGSPAM